MRNLILCISLFVAACGGGNTNAAPPSDPSTAPATPATPATSSATTSTTTTTTTETKPDGKCGQTVTTSATALDTCMADCEKLSDKAPEGSRCLPPRVECKQGCKHKFESGAK